MLDAVDFLLVNPWQRGFPLVPRPFAAVAAKTGISEAAAIERYRRLKERGVIDRIGPVFRPNTVGASTLAAMAVPPGRLAAVARLVSGHAGVNHNYEREHRINLWFVVTGPSEGAVQWTISCIEHASALPVLRLPLLEEFHVDLGFDLASGEAPRAPAPACPPQPPTAEERRLVAATAAGLPLVAEPYAQAGAAAGLSEERVLSRLAAMLADGRIRRIGAVVRHRRLGYEANAMALWDVPDGEAGALGRALAREGAVTLCYRRARAPGWPYNLYCMVHGRDRGAVAGEIERIGARHGLARFPRAVLFGRRCFSQRAASYG